MIDSDDDNIEWYDKKHIYWIRHAESCANIASIIDNISAKIKQPILTNKGIQQSILLGTNYINNNLKNLQCGFSSPVARTIMTALISMRTYYYKNNNFIIKLNPYISENLNFGSNFMLDNQNAIMSPLKIKLMIKLIKDWLEKFWLIEYDDCEFEQLLNNIYNNENNIIINNIYEHMKLMKTINQQDINILNTYQSNIKNLIKDLIKNNLDYTNELIKFIEPKFFRGPKIDISEYDEIYKTYKPLSYTNIDRFSLFYQMYDNNTIYNNIICFSHGSILLEKFSSAIRNNSPSLLDSHNKLKNTSVILETLDNASIVYPPINNLNLDNYKINDCFKQNSLNSIINKIGDYDNYIYKNDIFKLADENSIIHNITNFSDNLSNFTKNIEELKNISSFEKKYLKYKTKYLSLKKKLMV